MRKETVDLFSAPFMKKLNIAPFPLEADLIDLSTEFRLKLRTSLLTQGWQQDQFMIIATSEDVRLHGQPIQGRQRLIEIGELLKAGKKFDISKILIRFETVKNIDMLRAKRASYEASASLSKDRRISQRWIDANLRPIVKSRSEQGQKNILKYLHQCGFANDQISKPIIEDVFDALEKKRIKKERVGQPAGQSNFPEHLSDKTNWGLPGATALDDASTSYFREIEKKCEHCGNMVTVPINIAVGDERRLVRVELATIPIEQ